ncbi:MAG: acyl-CoA dehydrogenase family protein [Deltaproteobacteria bacterium]|nr:acyl-CoA dehydrogenase family protein [Deltaproteobacteria bacterium]
MAMEESFLKSVFHGAIPEEMVFPYPEPGREQREHIGLILDGVRSFARKHVDAGAIDREADIPESVLQGMRDLGLFGLTIPTEYGGAGLGATGFARIIQELAGYDASLAVTVGAHLSLGTSGLLLFGTEAQRRRLLPGMARGEHIGAFALTEAGAGSDAAGIQTRAELDRAGETWTLDGTKAWVTNGGRAGVITVFARTTAFDMRSKPRLTAFLVEAGEGVVRGPNDLKLGLRATSTPWVRFEGAKVPSENVLGEAGRGFRVAMEVLNGGRLSLAAGCVGMCRRLIRLSVDRAQERRAFGRTIGEFGMIKDKVARMMAETFALESMVYLTTGMVDAKVPDWSLESAICKVFGSEVLWRAADDALQIAAGIGYQQPHPCERMLRDARANPIFEGTNEVLRAFVALSGMQGPGRKLSEVVRAIREPIKGMGLMYEFAMQRARTTFGRERMNRAHNTLRREVVIFEEYVAHFQKSIDKVLRRHGKDIAEMQYTQRRVADLATDLYAMAAVISRTTRAIERKGEEGARREVELTMAFSNMAERRMAANLADFDDNDDEQRKGVAEQAYIDGGYSFDVV